MRLTCDGCLILMHDETVDRTTSGKGLVEELSLEEIKALRVQGLQVPTLAEALAEARELRLAMVVEMKEEGLEELVAETLKGSNSMVTSFYHSSLREIKELSDLRTGIIISSLPLKPVELALWAGADAIFPRKLNPRLFKEAHRQGLEIYPWIVNAREKASWLLRLGADGLVTDNPCLIREVADQPVQATGKTTANTIPATTSRPRIALTASVPSIPARIWSLAGS